MSKRIYLAIIIACTLTSIAGLCFYFYTNYSAKATIYSDTVLTPQVFASTSTNSFIPSVATDIQNITAPSSTLTLLAFGDIMLDRSVMLKTQAAQDYNFPFLLIDPLLQQYNLHMANLEGPITNNKSIANGVGGERFTFTFSPKFVDPLKNRFQFLSLANNHEYNFGQDGVNQTRKFLGGAGVQYFGDPGNTAGFISVTTTYNGITLGFVGYHQLIEKGFDNVIEEVKRLRPEVDVLIAMPHWGIEYATSTPSYLQVQDGHALIDAGVDIIVGSHPHVVEPIEVYKNKIIFYSLGNFVFDQYFSEETQTGLSVGMTMQKENGTVQIEYKLIPLNISGQSQPSVANAQKTASTLQNLANVSKVSETIKQEIRTGNIHF